jgi:twinkle protein
MTIYNWDKYGITDSGKRQGQTKVSCPECVKSGKPASDKSLSVNWQSGLFNCHRCGFAGCALDARDNMNIIPYTPKEYARPAPREASPYSDKMLAWFKGRGISEATLVAMKVGEGEEYIPQTKCNRNCVMFNYYRDNELINTKFRDGAKNFKFISGAELLPYNLDSCKGQDTVVVCEGEIDAMSWHEAGITSVVSVPNGANLKTNNTSWLDDCYDSHFEGKQRIILAIDNDKAGLVLRAELVRRFGAERCYTVDYGEGCKDSNEVLVRRGRIALIDVLDNAREVQIDGIFYVKDTEQELIELYKHGFHEGYTVGIDELDRYLSFEMMRLCVVTGIPNHGKSEFVDEMITRLNLRYGFKAAYFSPENNPPRYHHNKWLSRIIGRKYLPGIVSESDIYAAIDHINNNIFTVLPKENYLLDTILEHFKYLIRRRDVRIVVIDPYNALEHRRDKNDTETNYISFFLDKLHTFAQLNDVLVFLVVHPRKMENQKDTLTPRIPTLYDINGSANFYNKCDFGIIVHRNKDNTVNIIIGKVKFKHLGTVGECTLHYNYNNGRYGSKQFDTQSDTANLLHNRKKDPDNQLAIGYHNSPQQVEDVPPFIPMAAGEEIPF